MRGNALPNVKEILFGKPLLDVQDVELTLRRAQLAILNPTVKPAKFVDLELASGNDGKNQTRLDLKEPQNFRRM